MVLPFQITACASFVAIIAAWWFAHQWGYRRGRSVLGAIFLTALLFVPSCVSVKYLVDPFRFGMFHHSDFASVNDWRVERYLPDAATDIALEKPSHGNGFRAKFNISQTALDSWFNDSWAQGREYSIFSGEEAQDVMASPGFDDLGWPPLLDAVQYIGPTKGNGAGFTIWYSEANGIAYEEAGYW